MRKEMICDIHDKILDLCEDQRELLKEGRAQTQLFRNNLTKIKRLTKRAKIAGERMEGRLIMTKELFTFYAADLGYQVKRLR